MTDSPSKAMVRTRATGLNRRDLVKGLAAAAVAAPAIGTVGRSRPHAAVRRQDKPASLNMLYATVEADVDAIKLAIPDFKAATGIDIVLDSQPYDALQQKVFAELAVDSPYYDVIIVDTPWTPALTGKLEPLSSYLTNESLNDVSDPAIDDFIEKVFFDTAVYNPTSPNTQFPDQSAVDLAAITKGGFEVYGLPLQANALVAMYRTDLFGNADEKSAFESQAGRPL